MYSLSRAEIGGFSRYDVPVPPGSRREAGRQAFQQGGGCPGLLKGSQVMLLKAIREELTG